MRPALPLPVCCDPNSAPPSLRSGLEILAEEYPVSFGAGPGVRVRFELSGPAGGFCVERSRGGVLVRYGSPSMALRAVGAVMAGLAGAGAEESSPFSTVGIMLDCSRNAVMRVEHFKQWLRRLALLGYNMAMLYTEDTYALDGEDYFGRLRGRYTASELREIDNFAAALGIEMIPCIQTLGHLAQILQWPAYAGIRDTGAVLLAGEPKTYELIEKMVAHWKTVFRSRRIHIGMDETHGLGRGKYMDLHGYQRAFDIFNTHLARVVAVCRKAGLQPMIWSDMYFRLGSKRMNYYDEKSVIPRDVVAKIPKGVRLVYWDYYHDSPEFYLEWIRRHRLLGSEPLMGSGVWTWSKLWHDRRLTETNAGACIDASRRSGLKEIFFTLWGDDGAYCDFDSALAGLAFAAEKAFSPRFSEAALSARFRAVCRSNYAAHKLASGLESVDAQTASPAPMLWDDPLLSVVLSARRVADPRKLLKIERHYARLARSLEVHAGDKGCGDIGHAQLMAAVLAAKIGLNRKLFAAYAAGNRRALAAVRREIPGLVRLLNRLAESFRSGWLKRNKPFGLEVLQIRMAGIIARHRELDRRLAEYLAGRSQTIPELDENIACRCASAKTGNYAGVATSSAIL